MEIVRKYIRAYDKEVDCIVIDAPAPFIDEFGDEYYSKCYNVCRQFLVDYYDFSKYVAFNLMMAGFVEDNIVFVESYPIKFHFAVNFIQENQP